MTTRPMALKPYLQLVRLPNVFTAAADSLAGWLLVRGSFDEPGMWVPLVLASACTYAGGIVLNDVFDFEVDRVERPQRPLPSGRIGRRFAAVLGIALLVAGLILAAVSRTRHGLIVEAALIGCVLAYNAGLKRSALGPEVMGACRGLNLLLGMSQSAQLGGPVGWLAAVAYAGFVAGVTWISRSEVHSGLWKNIAVGLTLQNAAFLGLLLASTKPEMFPNPGDQPTIVNVAGQCVLVVIAIAVNGRSIAALRSPSPALIQRAVKFGILSLVWLHVGLVLAVRGPLDALAVGLFWVPATFVGRWIYST
jgi:4-hydroxybenzoate polyprenyltransferase